MLTVKCALVHGTGLLFAGGPLNVGLDRFRFGREDISKPHAGPTGDDGCTGVAEEGNAYTPLRSARPSLGLPAHESRATGSRRRKTSTRWMPGHYRSRQAFTGESGSGGVPAVFVARGTSASSSRRASHHVIQNSKGIAVSVEMRGSKLGSCARTSFLKAGCRSRQATTAGLIEAPSPVQGPGRSRDRRGVNGGLVQGVEPFSPSRNRGRRRSRGRSRRREDRTERGSCHAGSDSRPAGAQPPRMRVRLSSYSRHGGRSCLGETKASPMRNGTCRWKAFHGSFSPPSVT
jgi:hypothetical protein